MAIRRKRNAGRYSIAEARDALARIVHEAEQGAAVELTRRGQPVAAIVSIRDLQRLRDRGDSLWEALLAFRARTDLDELWAQGDPFQGLRDRSTGRAVRL